VIDLIRGGCVLLPSYDNLSATSDPSASNNNTQDYTVESRWVNTAARRLWSCISAATGAAAWALAGLVPGIGAEPANISTLFGGSTGMFLRAGNLYRLAGNPLAGTMPIRPTICWRATLCRRRASTQQAVGSA